MLMTEPLEKLYSVTDYMMSYLQGELTLTQEVRLKTALQSCEECRTIFEELKQFLETEDDPEFRERYQAVMASNRRFRNRLVAQNSDLKEFQHDYTSHRSKHEDAENAEGCLCCGA